MTGDGLDFDVDSGSSSWSSSSSWNTLDDDDSSSWTFESATCADKNGDGGNVAVSDTDCGAGREATDEEAPALRLGLPLEGGLVAEARHGENVDRLAVGLLALEEGGVGALWLLGDREEGGRGGI